MFETKQLIEFVTFAQCKTLTAAAEKLNLSQSALSRSIKKFEEETGVELFERSKNKIKLNDNGRLAAAEAEKILDEMDNMLKNIRFHDINKRTISIGSCAPSPLWEITPLISGLYTGSAINSEIKSNDDVIKGFEKGLYHIAILPKPIQNSKYISIKYIEEKLYLSVSENSPLASKKSITLDELNGETMLLGKSLGFWHDLCVEKMPDTQFIMQNTGTDFETIAKNSSLPFFVTSLSEKKYNKLHENKVFIPVTDKEANPVYYCIIRKKHRAVFAELIENIKQYEK